MIPVYVERERERERERKGVKRKFNDFVISIMTRSN